MTVTAIRYKNFMAFRDTGWIELRPIALLFGRNSSGKSAIIRGLRLLRQSLCTEEGILQRDRNALRLAVDGQLDLGDFRTALHQTGEEAAVGDEARIESAKMTFAFRCEVPDLVERLWQRINHAVSINQTKVVERDKESKWVELHLEFAQDGTWL